MLLLQKLEYFYANSEGCFCYFWIQPSVVPHRYFLCIRNVELIFFLFLSCIIITGYSYSWLHFHCLCYGAVHKVG